MLNLKQLKAVNANNRFIFLLAGAGTGKTTVIINRVKRLIEKGIKPNNILVLSFTRKSVLDLKSRLKESEELTITTFHGFCYKMLEKISPINIVQEHELIDYGFSKDELTIIDFYKRNNKTTSLVNKYNAFLKSKNLLDYTDLEQILLKKLKQNQAFKTKINQQFNYIFVDEFQDTSTLQYNLLKELTKEDAKMFCVGDPNQSIYSFRGASRKVIEKYVKEFKAEIYLLDENYRSTKDILKASNNIIKYNRSAFYFDLKANKKTQGKIVVKYFSTAKNEGEFVVKEIRKLLNSGYKQEEIAVIYRNHYFSNNVKDELYKTYFDRINLLTIHQAKGLEFSCVFVIGLEEGKTPLKHAYIEEERRLFYVAITRAKEKLYLLSTNKKKKESRFIKECLNNTVHKTHK